MERRIRIGLIIDFLSSEYTELLIEGIKECGHRMNADVFVLQIGQLENPSENFDYQCFAATAFITKNHLDGIVFVSAIENHFVSEKTLLSYIKKFSKIPVVNITEIIPDVPSIVSEYEIAYTSLIEHIIKDVKARKFLIITVDDKSDEVVKREKCIKKVFNQYHISYEKQVVIKSLFSYSKCMNSLTKYESENPSAKFDFDAIIALNDDMAAAAIDFFKVRGVDIPEKVVVVGFDDMRKAKLNNPPISTVNQKVFEQCYVASRTLYDMIFDKKVPPAQIIQAKGILRKSSNAENYFRVIQNNEYLEIDRAALAGSQSVYSAAEWYKKKTNLFRAAKCLLEMQSSTNKDNMFNLMDNYLNSFEITNFAIIAYEKPKVEKAMFKSFNLPSKANLFFYVNRKENVVYRYSSDEKISFNPNNDFLPEEYSNFAHNPILTVPLFVGETQYGYLLTEMVDIDAAVYDLVVKTSAVLLSRYYQSL